MSSTTSITTPQTAPTPQPAHTPNYNRTMIACFNGYVTQAVINNFLPLLFVTFTQTLQVSLTELSGLITVNFVTQLVVDVLAGKYVDRIGYKRAIIAAHVCAAAGLILLGVLPQHVSHPYAALLGSIFLYAIGGGLIEVMVSPIVEGCPSEHKAKAMSLLHSFYCWGQLATVGISTLCFVLFGMTAWPLVACLWALVPIAGIVMFAGAPMPRIVPEGVAQIRLSQLLRRPAFYLFFAMMLCAGAAEQGMSQWASAFAETGFDVSKTIGDLAGPAAFALTMALLVWHVGASHQSAGVYCRKLRDVYRHVCDCSVVAVAIAGTGGLRSDRFLGGHHVAGHVLAGG